MKVSIQLFGIIRQETEWKDIVEVEGGTPEECLGALVGRYPNAKKWIYNRHGEMLDRFQISVNDQLIQKDEFSSPLKEGDELSMLLNICGG